MNVYGKVRVEVLTVPGDRMASRHVEIVDNGKRTRLYPVVAGKRP